MTEVSSFHVGETLYEFVRFGEVAETTTQFLSLNLQYNTAPGVRPTAQRRASVSQVEQMVLQQARDYVSGVREGFVLSLRTKQVTRRSELRYLLDKVLVDWTALSRELGLEEFLTSSPLSDTPDDTAAGLPAPPIELEQLRSQLLAFGMAAAALGLLPTTPAERITFPLSLSDPPTYADIRAPNTPGEMLQRIEEIEETLWQLMAGDAQELAQRRYGPLRRTYGFFEVSAHLARRETERFGVKKRSIW
jgi:hypothetical protein